MTFNELMQKIVENGGLLFALKNNELDCSAKINRTTCSSDIIASSILDGLQQKGLVNIVKYLSTGVSLGFLDCGEEEIAATMVVEEGEYAVVFVLETALIPASDLRKMKELIKGRNENQRVVQKGSMTYVEETYADNLVTANGCADNIKISWGRVKRTKPQVVKEVSDRVSTDKTLNELMSLWGEPKEYEYNIGKIPTQNEMRQHCEFIQGNTKKLDLSALESAITEKARVDKYPIAVGEISENSELPINMITDAKIIGAELGELLNCHPEYQQKLIDIIAKTIKL